VHYYDAKVIKNIYITQENELYFYFFYENRCLFGKKMIPLHRFFRVMAN